MSSKVDVLDGEVLLEIKGDGACDLCFGLRLVSVRVLY